MHSKENDLKTYTNITFWFSKNMGLNLNGFKFLNYHLN